MQSLLQYSQEITMLLICITLALAWSWTHTLGVKRGFLAGGARIIWLLIPISMLYPKQKTEKTLNHIQHKKIAVLIDDSKSMARFKSQAKQTLQNLESKCQKLNCKIELTYFSDLNKNSEKKFSPITTLWQQFISEHQNDDGVILLTDGGDQGGRIESSFDFPHPNSLIIGFANGSDKNYWIDSFETQAVAFQGKPFTLKASVQRSGAIENPANVQAQLLIGPEVIASSDLLFEQGIDTIDWEISVPGLQQRGTELLSLKVLPSPGEVAFWDNLQHHPIEVQANTFGVLHLLGNPSWDGRFLRMYLKSEPKFDLVSFYILRDPWDQNNADERELSLIPFPVEQLFGKELANFKLIILQNFSLLQFLDPKYQKNLVEFVQNGGGLLFMGGDRALKAQDIKESPLQKILPFEYKNKLTVAKGQRSPQLGSSLRKTGIDFNDDIQFHIKNHPLKLERQILAGFYSEWATLTDTFHTLPPWQGMHHTEKASFPATGHTPLLFSQTPHENDRLLATASYPGNGRAIWLFSDQFWRLSMSQEQGITKWAYDKFFGSAFSWLLRHDEVPILDIQTASIHITELKSASSKYHAEWKMSVTGPASGHLLQTQKFNQVKICNQSIPPENISYISRGNHSTMLSGQLQMSRHISSCEVSIIMNHPEIGRESVSSSVAVEHTIPDSDNLGGTQHLKSLALKSVSTLVLNNEAQYQSQVSLWADNHLTPTSEPSTLTPVQRRPDHYWIFSRWWVSLLFAAIFLELIARKWLILINLLSNAK